MLKIFTSRITRWDILKRVKKRIEEKTKDRDERYRVEEEAMENEGKREMITGQVILISRRKSWFDRPT